MVFDTLKSVTVTERGINDYSLVTNQIVLTLMELLSFWKSIWMSLFVEHYYGPTAGIKYHLLKISK